ncbi:hypothetical protein LTR37_012095 [Vermiconidia calcicola]|uniref:Uncharacterized protein n=1 Tax=Vermiconidia calcicola TaxID=1690605 RepID=A0ACC3N1F1_9PEZI|nr:hypothetical protein LTR37_012095 [Vermiconidia calcicola]
MDVSLPSHVLEPYPPSGAVMNGDGPKTTRIFLFGDQTLDICANFLQLLSCRQGPIGDAFSKQCLIDIRNAVDSLPYAHRRCIPRFASFHDLIGEKEQGTLHPALDQVLASVYHLSAFISDIERNARPYPTAEDACLIGLCTGGIAAAAVGACRTLSELLPVAACAVRLAFWTGVSAVTAGENLYPTTPNAKPAHWSLLLPNMSYEQASRVLREFASESRIPASSMPWISATAEKSATLSGPPDKLGAFYRSEAFSGRSSALLPIHAPYHASSIFNERSIDFVLEEAGAFSLPDLEVNIPIIADHGESSAGDTLLASLRAAAANILRLPMRWEKITEAVNAHVASSLSQKVSVVSIGTKLGNSLRTSILNAGKVQHVDLQQCSPSEDPTESTSGPKQDKIAIIGMSGRFPEADDCDEFWNILSQGLDVHKMVPDFHWSKEHVDTSGTRKNTSATPYGCWLKNPGMFDAKFFQMSPREASQVDRSVPCIVGARNLLLTLSQYARIAPQRDLQTSS